MTLPPASSFIPHLPILRRQLTPALGNDNYRDVHFQLELLPYCLEAASSALENLHLESQKIVSDCLPPNQSASRTIVLPKPEHSRRLSYNVDHFLDVARRAQNAWIPYLSRRFGLSLPSSLSELMKQLNKSQDLGLPEEIRHELIAYWKDHGQRLKDYRDLSQHYALVLSEAQVFRAPDGTPSIQFTLPNNPQVKSSRQLSFEDPTVHAFFYIRDQYCELVAFSNWLCDKLLEGSATRHVGLLSVVPRVSLNLGDPCPPGHQIPTESAVAQEIAKRIAAWQSKGEGGSELP